MSKTRTYTDEQIDQIKRDPNTLRCYTDRLRFKKEGPEYVAGCPFHGGTGDTPSFKLHIKHGQWLWSCLGACQETGNVIQFVQKIDNLGKNFNEAVRRVEETIGSSWSATHRKVDQVFQPIEPEKKEYKTYPLASYMKLVDALQESKAGLDFLMKERGITPETARKMCLGFRQSVGDLAKRDCPDLADKGWIVFPYIQGDKVVLFKYRSIAKKQFLRQPGMATTLFNTESIDPFEPVYLVEGEFDACALAQIGLSAVSLPSAVKNLAPELKDILMQADRVVLAGDCDNGAGTDAMNKLWRELKDRTYLLKWPDGMKDANQTLVQHCKKNTEKFAEVVDSLSKAAYSQPAPGIYSLQETMETMQEGKLIDHPQRLRFPWKAVDEMAIILPGSVTTVSATNTGMGKTAWTAQATLFGAREHGEVVLNYQGELSQIEFATLITAHVLHKDRNELTDEDHKAAAAILGGAKYYVGYDPDLNTIGPVLDLIEMAIRVLGATVVVLDHKHFFIRNEENQTQAEANADQRIKLMASKYGVKFVVLGQPRKATQQTKGKVIHISDLKGSETGSSDSNNVLFIHRNTVAVKDPNNPPDDEYEPMTQIHRKKARFCGQGKAYTELMFEGKTATFYEVDRHQTASNG